MAPVPGLSPLSAAARPDRLLLQWHLTDRCNLRCAHCYQDEYRTPPGGLASWQELLDRFLVFLRGPASPIPGHINLTGGEPFVLEELPALMELFVRHRREFSFAVLSNGTLVDRPLARQLKSWGVRFVQVSIEGGEETHDRLRGPGSFQRAVAGLGALRAAGVPTMIAFTAQRSNWREFPLVAALGRQVGAGRVWADRLIPAGQAQRDQVLDPGETRAFFTLMAESRARPLRFFSRRRTAMHRALQFLVAEDEMPYRCTAGDTLLTLMPDGTVYPCRRLPIPLGDLFRRPLAELYDEDLARRLRVPAWQGEGCQDCGLAAACRGGLRCLAYAVHGRLDVADPGCWLAAAAPAAAPATAGAAA
ncbi:MAG TPA: radical SAM protein [Rhodocyclaceae bacterium]|nr:radical SAM protein [Rhodocyclaceae bacterium]